jgi:hypothetical protein
MAWTHTIKSAVRSAANKSNIEVTVEWTDGVQIVVTKPMGNDLSPDTIKPILRNQQKALEEGDVALAAWAPVVNTALDLTLTAEEQAAADKAAKEQAYAIERQKVAALHLDETIGITVDQAEKDAAIAAADAAKADIPK